MSMTEMDRRKAEKELSATLKRSLNEAQLATLQGLEHFGWELKFVRRKPFQPSVPVVFDGDRKKFAVLEEDGSLNENPGFEIRQ
ncbi:MAG: hypothetical protein WC213_08775 [Arenimonas sp.]|jgi:hypothetical protein